MADLRDAGSMRHTPGNWRCRREKWPSSPAWLIEAELVCINGLEAWFPIAHIFIEHDAIQMSGGSLSPEGDAHLIAAAPQLMESLREMKELFRFALLNTAPEIAKDGMEFICNAEALISKATGGSP